MIVRKCKERIRAYKGRAEIIVFQFFNEKGLLWVMIPQAKQVHLAEEAAFALSENLQEATGFRCSSGGCYPPLPVLDSIVSPGIGITKIHSRQENVSTSNHATTKYVDNNHY
jgi:hypothetical protein